MCSSVVVGALVDKHGERRVLAVGASLWSFATLLTPWAANHSTTSLLVEFISAAASAIPRFSLFINSTWSIYFDSAGVSGPIPQTFANLRSLTTVWASDNELTGWIPDFIGNWSRLNTLRFQGNSFQGPIPASFSNLTMLSDLRISDLSNGSSSLNFLRNMASLLTLILRNNNISGSIPSYFGEFQSLSFLDLSFNNLTGTIPESLFNRSSLTNM